MTPDAMADSQRTRGISHGASATRWSWAAPVSRCRALVLEIAIGVCAEALCAWTASAQQTIFNVPSADLTTARVVYLQQEVQFRTHDPGAYWFATEYSALGIDHDTELDATLYNVSEPPSHNISLGLGFKSVLPFRNRSSPERQYKWTLGAQAVPSLQGEGLGAWGYTHLSGRLPGSKTRLTAGISAGSHQLFGTSTVHFIGGIEQPLTRDLALVSDWYSGIHSLGFWTSGFAWTLPGDLALFAGYQIPNDRSRVARAGFTIELAVFLR